MLLCLLSASSSSCPQQWSSRLTCSRENVCMTVSEEKNLYAVGSHSYVTLVDSRKKVCQPIPAKQRERGLCQGKV